MAARLVFLGRLRDAAGASELQVDPGAMATVLAALPAVLALEVMADRVRWALNGALVSRDDVTSLGDGDELAFLPPVSGG